MVIPSQACELQEGVETGRQAPSGESLGEGTVQPTNPKGAVKAVVGCITGWSQVRILPGPLQFIPVGKGITGLLELMI
jgi:hypothetical protein